MKNFILHFTTFSEPKFLDCYDKQEIKIIKKDITIQTIKYSTSLKSNDKLFQSSLPIFLRMIKNVFQRPIYLMKLQFGNGFSICRKKVLIVSPEAP